MPGPAHFATDVDAASSARAGLDRAAALVDAMEVAQREVLAALVQLWPSAAWLAAGLDSAKKWLLAHTSLTYPDAARLERIAELCARDGRLADAILDGSVPLGRADRLARAVTSERAPFLQGSIDALLGVAIGTDEATFDAALRYWVERVDEHLAPRRVQSQSLTFAERLFGGGDIFGSLAPVPFATVRAAVDAFTQDPDPKDAPYQRTLSERRADALDDLAAFVLAGGSDSGAEGDADLEDDDLLDPASDTFDGSFPGDSLDESLLPENEGLDPLDLLRSRLRKAEVHRRRRAVRRTKPRSTATVNVHIDLRTLAGVREHDDLDGLVLRGPGWNLTRSAAEQFLCDASFSAVLFGGRNQVLDVNDAAERFSPRQRRAIAARDRCCVFPGCARIPAHCDIHHLHERAAGGPTRVSNGVLLCRFHHRLLHQHRWSLHRDEDGSWVAVDAHGEHWRSRPAHQSAA